MAYRKMPSLVATLYERVQNLLQEAQIRVEESHITRVVRQVHAHVSGMYLSRSRSGVL